MANQTIYYRVPDQCPESAHSLDVPEWWGAPSEASDERREHMASEAAENYEDYHDGWECDWPLDITLHDTEDGPAVARVRVEREMQPVYSANVVAMPEEPTHG